MGRYTTEAGVFAVLPFDIERPDNVRADGNGGVTRATYDRLDESVEAELSVRLDMAGVNVANRRHRLVVDAANLLLGAQIARKLKSYQDVANSLFADANIKLRLFLEGVARTSERSAGGETIVAVGEVLTDGDLASSGLGLSVFRQVGL